MDPLDRCQQLLLWVSNECDADDHAVHQRAFHMYFTADEMLASFGALREGYYQQPPADFASSPDELFPWILILASDALGQFNDGADTPDDLTVKLEMIAVAARGIREASRRLILMTTSEFAGSMLEVLAKGTEETTSGMDDADFALRVYFLADCSLLQMKHPRGGPVHSPPGEVRNRPEALKNWIRDKAKLLAMPVTEKVEESIRISARLRGLREASRNMLQHHAASANGAEETPKSSPSPSRSSPVAPSPSKSPAQMAEGNGRRPSQSQTVEGSVPGRQPSQTEGSGRRPSQTVEGNGRRPSQTSEGDQTVHRQPKPITKPPEPKPAQQLDPRIRAARLSAISESAVSDQ
mmetsp:Transcript_14968/g.26214  ORF Transcript_14968/g.26214 Transcript_14968/m.26214 type:complete len:351 (-) Transcript_14968:11-1063(-)